MRAEKLRPDAEAAPGSRADLRRRAGERRQQMCVFAGDQILESAMDQRVFIFNSGQLPGFVHQAVVQVEHGLHIDQYD